MTLHHWQWGFIIGNFSCLSELWINSQSTWFKHIYALVSSWSYSSCHHHPQSHSAPRPHGLLSSSENFLTFYRHKHRSSHFCSLHSHVVDNYYKTSPMPRKEKGLLLHFPWEKCPFIQPCLIYYPKLNEWNDDCLTPVTGKMLSKDAPHSLFGPVSSLSEQSS